MSSFQGVSEAIRAKGLFCSLYADRASHYWNTPEAGGKVDKDTPTQVGRALAQLGIELIPGPRQGGAACSAPLPQEASPTFEAKQGGWLRDPGRGTAFVPFTLRHPVHPRTHRLKRQHGASAWHSPPAATGHYVKARVRVHESMASSMDRSGAIPRRWPTDREAA